MVELRNHVTMLAKLFLEAGESRFAEDLRDALSRPDEDLLKHLGSNEVWGGSGSIADQALIDHPLRHDFELLMIELGRMLIALDEANPRTGMWIEAFEGWR
jgi:hypothetical protein